MANAAPHVLYDAQTITAIFWWLIQLEFPVLTFSSLGNSISTPIGGTSGELELGFSKGNAQSGGWGFYGSAGYLFDISGAEYSGWKGTLGLRKGW